MLVGALIATLLAIAPNQADSARGRGVVDSAVAALGGAERIATTSWYVEGRGRENTSGENQGLSPSRPTWRPHEERVAVDAANLAVAWERRSPRNDQSLRWRTFIYTRDSSGFIDWNGNDGSMNGHGVREEDRWALARRIPHLLLLDIATKATALEWSGEQTLEGKVADIVTAYLPHAGALTVWIARTPRLLRRVEYRTYLPGRGDVTVVWTWSGWTPNARLGYVPHGHIIDIAGARFQEVTYQHFEANAARVAEMLSVPMALRTATGGSTSAIRPLPGEPHWPATGEISPGVHVASIAGFVVMFVEFHDFVVAVEAPQAHPGFEGIPAIRGSAHVSSDFVALIQKMVPGKPIRYVIVSHHHSDHMGGLRAFAAEGATIIVAPSHLDAARTVLDAPHTIAPDGWTGTSRDVRIETVAKRRTISDGTRSLEIWNVGPNPHTDENLFVWLPAEGVLFQGDLFYYGEGDPFPPAGREIMNRFFADWLRSRDIAPRAIYGVHNGGAAGPQRLVESLAGTVGQPARSKAHAPSRQQLRGPVQ